MKDILDKHAPLKKVKVKVKNNAPWYSGEIHNAKVLRKKYERRWRKTGAESFERFTKQRNVVVHMLNQCKKDYYSEKIKSSTTNGDMFKIANELLNSNDKHVLPTFSSEQELANRFAEYFQSKIETIRNSLSHGCVTEESPGNDDPLLKSSSLSAFEAASDIEVIEVINNMPNKSSKLDPVPTWLVKACTTELAAVFLHIANLSFSSGHVPTALKCALVKPLLKKQNLDKELLKNYRPVSNLPFLSKFLEKLAASRLKFYFSQHNIDNVYQSAYTQHRSTEPALVRIHNDMCQAVDKTGAAAVVMLDLSAAFDTLDHPILLNRLEQLFGLQGITIQWLSSYLADRSQSIQVNSTQSKESKLQYGVPQGSVLGPLLFNMYTYPLASVIQKNNLLYHMYPDDTQIYLSFNPKSDVECSNALAVIQGCLHDIQSWMSANWLKLNPDKTEVLLVSTQSQIQNIVIKSVNCCGTPVNVCKQVRNLGVTFDSCLSMTAHVEAVCKSVNYQLRNLWRIRKYLDQTTTSMLVHSLISSRIDYCNALLCGIPQYLINRLQRLQNTAARLVTLSSRSCHITPVLYKLHWLPVSKRIDYKILLHVYKALNGISPKYICELVHFYTPGRALRSTHAGLLHVPRTRLCGFGDRSFSAVAPKLWNALPANIRNASSTDIFKSLLKTYLFQGHLNSNHLLLYTLGQFLACIFNSIYSFNIP